MVKVQTKLWLSTRISLAGPKASELKKVCSKLTLDYIKTLDELSEHNITGIGNRIMLRLKSYLIRPGPICYHS